MNGVRATRIWWGALGVLVLAMAALVARSLLLAGSEPAWLSPAAWLWQLRIMIVALSICCVSLVGLLLGRVLAERRLRARAEALARERQTARDAAERANRVKSEFLATIGHEIRTPMNGIIGTAELLLHAVMPDEPRALAATLWHSALNLLAVMDDILDVSSLESGTFALREAPFDLLEQARAVLELFQPQASARGVHLALLLTGPAPPMLVGDAGRLRQVLVNLVSNAVKFTPSGSVTVEVSLPPEAGGPLPAHGPVLVRCTVRDTGIGIAPEDQARLFSTFHQVDASNRRRFGGSGLGLAICRRLLSLMGGTIAVESAPGVGSSFGFALSLPRAPISPAPVLPAPVLPAPVLPAPVLPAPVLPAPVLPAPVSPTPGRPHAAGSEAPCRRVLVVEDNPTNQLVVRAMLQRLGQQVEVAADGQAAVAAMRRAAFDLILMDVQMPGMDGYEATRRIRALGGPAATVPIVALTANAAPGDSALSRQAGMDGHIAKPITSERLRTLLSGRGLMTAR